MSLRFGCLSLFLNINCHSHACQCIHYLIKHYWSIIQSKHRESPRRQGQPPKNKRLVSKISFVQGLDCNRKTWCALYRPRPFFCKTSIPCIFHILNQESRNTYMYDSVFLQVYLKLGALSSLLVQKPVLMYALPKCRDWKHFIVSTLPWH